MGLVCGCSTQASEKMTPEMKTFYEELDPVAQKEFLELDSSHRRASMSVVDHYCKANHECKGVREEAVHKQYTLQKDTAN